MTVWAMRKTNFEQLARFRYTCVVALFAVAITVALTGTWPNADPVYAPMGLALAAGLLLTVRLAPYRPGGALVLLPAMAMDARLGLAVLPMLAYVAIVVNLARGMRGQRVVSTAAHLVLAYA